LLAVVGAGVFWAEFAAEVGASRSGGGGEEPEAYMVEMKVGDKPYLAAWTCSPLSTVSKGVH
jgi:hypothetical protein